MENRDRPCSMSICFLIVVCRAHSCGVMSGIGSFIRCSMA